MLSRLHASALIGAAALLWGAILLVRGVPLSWDHFWPFGTVVGLVVLLGAAFDRWSWRWGCLHGWFVKRPDLSGTWRVRLESGWIDPDTETQIAPIDGFMPVKQSFTSLQMRLMTSESASWLIADRIKPSGHGNGYQIVGVFVNQPELPLRGEKSEIHYGSFVLESHGADGARPAVVEGTYWTDRGTRGVIRLSECVAEIHTRFEDAQAALGGTETPETTR